MLSAAAQAAGRFPSIPRVGGGVHSGSPAVPSAAQALTSTAIDAGEHSGCLQLARHAASGMHLLAHEGSSLDRAQPGPRVLSSLRTHTLNTRQHAELAPRVSGSSPAGGVSIS